MVGTAGVHTHTPFRWVHSLAWSRPWPFSWRPPWPSWAGTAQVHQAAWSAYRSTHRERRQDYDASHGSDKYSHDQLEAAGRWREREGGRAERERERVGRGGGISSVIRFRKNSGQLHVSAWTGGTRYYWGSNDLHVLWFTVFVDFLTHFRHRCTYYTLMSIHNQMHNCNSIAPHFRSLYYSPSQLERSWQLRQSWIPDWTQHGRPEGRSQQTHQHTGQYEQPGKKVYTCSCLWTKAIL